MFKRWWHKRIVRRSQISPQRWQEVFAQLPLLRRLSTADQARLRELTILFLYQKNFIGTHQLQVTEQMKLLIGLQACLLILHLGIEWYDDWSTIIVYPQGFVPRREVMDEHGIVHQQSVALSGEAWQDEPVILSWDEVADAAALDASNLARISHHPSTATAPWRALAGFRSVGVLDIVSTMPARSSVAKASHATPLHRLATNGGEKCGLVIHEFAHKLDMRNGAANGMPPLHAAMQRRQWTEVFSQAYADFQQQARSGTETVIDAYAASDPAEFFAVVSEVFFECPDALQQLYPRVYRLLTEFYRQDPLHGQQSMN